MRRVASICIRTYGEMNLVLRIVCGMAVGVTLALTVPGWTAVGLLGDMFVGMLKAIAPVLVALLVTSSIAARPMGESRKFGFVIFLYLLSTFASAVVAVVGAMLFPQTLVLQGAFDGMSAPCGLAEVFKNLLAKVTANPVAALAEANYLGVLFWSVMCGLSLRRLASAQFKTVLVTLSDGVSRIVRWIVGCAPFGVLGIVFSAVSQNGPSIFRTYGSLVALLVGCMAFVALVMNPLIVFLATWRNPYPLVLTCLRRSGVTAFFTRSSAANIPVNMELCEDLGLDRNLYSVSIPLGATINISGAAVTITVMTLAAANTIGVRPDALSALLLSVLAAFAACGASGVAGGSLLLMPMACSLFGIGGDVAMQVVGTGFVIGVIQDSVETMLNSSGDVIFAATAELRSRR